MAPSPKNQNALSHGIHAGVLPPGCGPIAKRLAKFRSVLEAAVVEAKGEIGLYDAAAINSAERWERHAQLAARWLKVEAKSLTPDQRLAFSRDVARASSERDKCLRALGLDAKPDPWSVLDSLPLAAPAGPASAPAPSDGQSGDLGGDLGHAGAAPAPEGEP